MFSEVMSGVSNEIANKTVCEQISEINVDMFELFEREAAAMDVVTDRIINEECLLSVKAIVTEEVRLVMLSYADGHCKCADEIDKL